MLAATTTGFVARLSAYMASALLLLPPMPVSGCGCSSRTATHRRCCCAVHARTGPRGKDHDACCHGMLNACRRTVRPPSPSCGHRPAVDRQLEEWKLATYCAKQTSKVADSTGHVCRCGAGCPCCLSKRSDTPPAVPAPNSESAGAQRIDRALATPSITVLGDTHARLPRFVTPSLRIDLATSLDRCIALSRFTC